MEYAAVRNQGDAREPMSRETKEFLFVVVSVWSVTFIYMLIFWLAIVGSVPEKDAAAWAGVFLGLQMLSVTGAGWLWHRSDLKTKEAEDDE